MKVSIVYKILQISCIIQFVNFVLVLFESCWFVQAHQRVSVKSLCQCVNVKRLVKINVNKAVGGYGICCISFYENECVLSLQCRVSFCAYCCLRFCQLFVRKLYAILAQASVYAWTKIAFSSIFNICSICYLNMTC